LLLGKRRRDDESCGEREHCEAWSDLRTQDFGTHTGHPSFSFVLLFGEQQTAMNRSARRLPLAINFALHTKFRSKQLKPRWIIATRNSCSGTNNRKGAMPACERAWPYDASNS
jgi:hypothetical protein